MKDVPLTLTGCAVAGEARDSYLLTNVVVDGTTMAPADAFYRFNTTKGLKDHVGQLGGSQVTESTGAEEIRRSLL